MTEFEQFRSFCVEQIERLGVFEKYQFMNSAGRKEFRKFFEARTRDHAKVEAVLDEAIKLESIPTLFELSAIWTGLYPAPGTEPALTDEERQARAQYLRDWYTQEAEEAKRRREVFVARQPFAAKPVTDDEIERLRKTQEQNRERIAEAAKGL